MIVRFLASTLLLLAAATPAHSQEERPLPFHVEVLHPAQIARAGGDWFLVYELHLTNFSAGDFELVSIEVFADSVGPALLGRFAGDRLTDNLKHFPAAEDDSALAVLEAGRRFALMTWLPIDSAAAPTRLAHRISARLVGRADPWIVNAPAIDLPLRPSFPHPVVIGPPLSGGPWVAAYAPNPSAVPGHTRLVFPRAARLHFPQRFSADWLRLGPDGRAWRGDVSRNESWYGYGQDVLAVADGRVVSILDGVAENAPPEVTTRITQPTVAGNYIVLDIGRDRFAVYGHLRPGSLRVAVGDHVQRGDVIAQVGNSGNSTGPHLHFHILDVPHTAAGEGLVFALDRFLIAGMLDVTLDDLDVGAAAAIPAGGEVRTRDLPLENSLVVFP